MLCKRLALPPHDAGIKEVPTKQQLNEIEENIKYMEDQMVRLECFLFCMFVLSCIKSFDVWKI